MPKGQAANPQADRRRRENRQSSGLGENSMAEKRRTPFNAGFGRFKLSIRKRLKGYHYCWMNDDNGMLERAMNGGYEFATPDEVGEVGQTDVASGNTDLGSRVSRVVGRNRLEQPIRAYLMRIKDEWHDEDMQLLEQENLKVDQAIRGAAGDFSVANSYGEIKYGN